MDDCVVVCFSFVFIPRDVSCDHSNVMHNNLAAQYPSASYGLATVRHNDVVGPKR